VAFLQIISLCVTMNGTNSTFSLLAILKPSVNQFQVMFNHCEVLNLLQVSYPVAVGVAANVC
jgi:hypothetical protein